MKIRGTGLEQTLLWFPTGCTLMLACLSLLCSSEVRLFSKGKIWCMNKSCVGIWSRKISDTGEKSDGLPNETSLRRLNPGCWWSFRSTCKSLKHQAQTPQCDSLLHVHYRPEGTGVSWNNPAIQRLCKLSSCSKLAEIKQILFFLFSGTPLITAGYWISLYFNHEICSLELI